MSGLFSSFTQMLLSTSTPAQLAGALAVGGTLSKPSSQVTGANPTPRYFPLDLCLGSARFPASRRTFPSFSF